MLIKQNLNFFQININKYIFFYYIIALNVYSTLDMCPRPQGSILDNYTSEVFQACPTKRYTVGTTTICSESWLSESRWTENKNNLTKSNIFMSYRLELVQTLVMSVWSGPAPNVVLCGLFLSHSPGMQGLSSDELVQQLVPNDIVLVKFVWQCLDDDIEMVSLEMENQPLYNNQCPIVSVTKASSLGPS